MEKTNRCLILSACPVSEELRRCWQPGDYVIACDAGWHNARRLGLVPDLVLGDFDSSRRPEGLGEGELLVLPREKDDTDTHYAARLAAEKGFAQATLLGALGGLRMEHTLANLATGLWLEKQGVRAILEDERSRVQYLMPGRPLRLARANWPYFSLFPLEGTAAGVCIRGAKYPLENGTLTADFPLAVSNAFAADEVELTVAKGPVVVIATLGDGAEL